MDFGISGAKYFIWLLGNSEIWPVFCNHYNEEKVEVHWQAQMTSLHRLRSWVETNRERHSRLVPMETLTFLKGPILVVLL